MLAERLVRLADVGRRLEVLGDGRVPLSSRGAWERLVRDVLDEAVLEAELLVAADARHRFAPDEVSVLQRAEERSHVVPLGDARERAAPEDPADDRSVHQDAALGRWKRIQARSDDGPDARGQLACGGALGDRRRELFDEQRVAVRGRSDRLGAIGRVTGLGEELFGELAARRAGQRLQRERRVRGQAAAPARAVGQELGPGERDEEHGDLAHACREHLEQVEEALVRPVDVLVQEQGRRAQRERLDEDAGREEERLAVDALVRAREAEEDRELWRVLLRGGGAGQVCDPGRRAAPGLPSARRCRRCPRPA